jgi:FAS-associated factor 2
MAEVADLSPEQQDTLQQYIAVTDQPTADAIGLLRRSEWNVQIAVAKFFDGEGPDPVAEAMAAQAVAPAAPPRMENLQDSFVARRPRHGRSEPAPRVVPRQPGTTRTPWFISLMLSPFALGVRFVSTLFRSILYILAILPASVRPRAIQGAIGPGLRSATGRRMQMPRDTAARFRREFEETYSSSELPWFEGGLAQAHDLAKAELRFLLVVLISPEHDDTEHYVEETLLAPEVVSFVNDPANRVILWGGNMLDSEAYQVSQEYNCTKFPFAALVCLTPKEGVTQMGIVKRLVGPSSAASFVAELRSAMDQYRPDLDQILAQRAAQEVARNLRTEQDSAYERSLARDRERARVRREEAAAAEEAQRRAREEEERVQREAKRREAWRKWRAARVLPEPEAGPDAVRLALKLPEDVASTRVVRRFPAGASMEELYAFVECFELLGEEGGEAPVADAPDGYEHAYRFRIASVMPREVYAPSKAATIGETVGRAGQLIVEVLAEGEEWDES